MDWKLILQLSLFGLAMGIATVFAIPQNVEPAFWLAIFLICAYAIARARPTGRFIHGLLLGLANSVWITSAHLAFFERYLAGRPQEAAMLKNMPGSPKLMMALTGLVAGLISGVLIGLLAWAAGKLVKQPLRDAKGTAA